MGSDIGIESMPQDLLSYFNATYTYNYKPREVSPECTGPDFGPHPMPQAPYYQLPEIRPYAPGEKILKSYPYCNGKQYCPDAVLASHMAPVSLSSDVYFLGIHREWDAAVFSSGNVEFMISAPLNFEILSAEYYEGTPSRPSFFILNTMAHGYIEVDGVREPHTVALQYIIPDLDKKLTHFVRCNTAFGEASGLPTCGQVSSGCEAFRDFFSSKPMAQMIGASPDVVLQKGFRAKQPVVDLGSFNYDPEKMQYGVRLKFAFESARDRPSSTTLYSFRADTGVYS